MDRLGRDEGKEKDCQPVGRDGQLIYWPVACPDEAANLEGVQNKFISIHNLNTLENRSFAGAATAEG